MDVKIAEVEKKERLNKHQFLFKKMNWQKLN